MNDTGTKIAIALGTVLGVLAIFGAGAFVVLKKRRDKGIRQMPQHRLDFLDGKGRYEYPRVEPLELQESIVHELPGNAKVEELPSPEPDDITPITKRPKLADGVKNNVTVRVEEVGRKTLEHG